MNQLVSMLVVFLWDGGRSKAESRFVWRTRNEWKCRGGGIGGGEGEARHRHKHGHTPRLKKNGTVLKHSQFALNISESIVQAWRLIIQNLTLPYFVMIYFNITLQHCAFISPRTYVLKLNRRLCNRKKFPLTLREHPRFCANSLLLN